jgi:hypothetical protein
VNQLFLHSMTLIVAVPKFAAIRSRVATPILDGMTKCCQSELLRAV